MIWTGFVIHQSNLLTIKLVDDSAAVTGTTLLLVVSDLGVGLLVHPMFTAVEVMELKQINDHEHVHKATRDAFLMVANLFIYASLFGGNSTRR